MIDSFKKNFVIAGGGSAGWMTASIISQIFPDSKITLIEGTAIGAINVGESTTPILLDFINISKFNLTDFLRKNDATIKVGIKFENWTQQNKSYLNTFTLDTNDNSWGYSHFHHFLEGNHRDENYEKYTLVPYTIEGRQVGTHALHLNAIKLIQYIKDNVQHKVRVIDNIITDVSFDKDGVKNIMLDSGETISADMYFDCTGFKRVLHNKLGSDWKSLKHIFPVDRALPCILDKIKPVNFTHASTLSDGWVWQVPLTTRMGIGYVYSSEFSKDPEAEFINFSKQKYGKEVTPDRVIKFESGYVSNPWEKNVVTIGLSSGFLEPLESTALHIIFHQIMAFSQMYDGTLTKGLAKIYNNYMVDMYDDTVAFVKLHYLGKPYDNNFWNYVNKKESIDNRLLEYLELWKSHFPCADHIGQNKNTTQGYRIFEIGAWIQVLFGVGLLSKEKILNYVKFNNIPKYQRSSNKLITQEQFIYSLG